jgi:hypothetical protein
VRAVRSRRRAGPRRFVERGREDLLLAGGQVLGRDDLFWKSKFLGIQKGKYQLLGLQDYRDQHMTLTWKKDAAWHW